MRGGEAVDRWVDEKKRRWHVRTSGGLSSIIYGDVCHAANARRVKPRCLRRPLRYDRDSGKQAGGFIFLPFVLAIVIVVCVWGCEYIYIYNICVCVCVLRFSTFSNKRKKRRWRCAFLSALCSTGFLLERGKDASCLKSRYSVRTCTIIPEYLPVATTNQQRHTQITISEEDVFPPEVLADDYSTIRYRQ